MHKLILALTIAIALGGCSMPPDTDTAVSQAPAANTTNATPLPSETLHESALTVETPPEPVSTPNEALPQLASIPIETSPELVSTPAPLLPKPAVSIPIKKKSVFTSSNNKQVSSNQLVANIRQNIGCGKVDKEYQIQVMAMAIAQSNPKATQKLTEDQFYQAVRQTIAENQAQANNLVAKYRASNCGIASKQQSKVASVKSTIAPNNKIGTLVPEQTGNCKELSARGITNIDVKTNPWASRLDRDNDGIACEAN